MKWSRYNFLFHSEKISYALFNSRMLSFSILDKKTYEILSAVKNDIHSVSSLLSQDEINRLKKKKVLVQDHEDDNYLGMLRYRKQLQSTLQRHWEWWSVRLCLAISHVLIAMSTICQKA